MGAGGHQGLFPGAPQDCVFAADVVGVRGGEGKRRGRGVSGRVPSFIGWPFVGVPEWWCLFFFFFFLFHQSSGAAKCKPVIVRMSRSSFIGSVYALLNERTNESTNKSNQRVERTKPTTDVIRRGMGTAERHAAMMNQGQAPPAKETEDAIWVFEQCVELIEGRGDRG